MKEKRPEPAPEHRIGPRGGTTTITVGGHIRKTVYLGPEEAEELRQDAFRQRRRESDVLREIVRQFYRLDDRSDDRTADRKD
jgi:hypothetical protein